MLDATTLGNAAMLADGGWSTVLRARGLPADIVPEVANLTHPAHVLDLARAYVRAGARFLVTNTFGANALSLARQQVSESVHDVNRAGVELARQAVGNTDVYVVGTVGPSGRMLAVDEIKPTDLKRIFAEQIETLLDAGVGAILLETFSELAEILLAVSVVKSAGTVPVIASMSFDSGPQRTHTVMGAEAGDCAAALEDAGADVIGSNCGGGIATALPAVVALRAVTKLPLWVKPNAGLPDLVDGRPVYRQTPQEFVGHAPPLLAAGANVLGGCCGVGPEHIERLGTLLGRRVSGG